MIDRQAYVGLCRCLGEEMNAFLPLTHPFSSLFFIPAQFSLFANDERAKVLAFPMQQGGGGRCNRRAIKLCPKRWVRVVTLTLLNTVGTIQRMRIHCTHAYENVRAALPLLSKPAWVR